MTAVIRRLGTRLREVSLVSWIALALSVGLHTAMCGVFRVRIPSLGGRRLPIPGVSYRPPSDALDPAAAVRFETQMILRDPTLLSLPNRRGFSRDVIDRWLTVRYRRPVWGWQDASLPAPAVEGTGREILEDRTAAELAAVRAAPAPPRPVVGATAAPPPWPTGVIWQARGDLAGVEVTRPPAFAALETATPKGPLELRIGVDGWGRPRHISVTRRSGDPAVDAAATAALATARFAPADAGGDPADRVAIRWGVATVFWPWTGPQTPPEAADDAPAQDAAVGEVGPRDDGPDAAVAERSEP